MFELVDTLTLRQDEAIVRRLLATPIAAAAATARLESDPHPEIRQEAAWWLLHRAGEERCRRALQAAATEDEDAEVRWIARYALRLAEGAASGMA